MSSEVKAYVPKKSRRLAMLPEEIQKLVDVTPRKPRRIIQSFEEVLHTPINYSIEVLKPNEESRLTEWKFDCPPAPELFWKSVKDNLENIVLYTQQLGMAQEYHPEDIKLLLEAVTKHFLWGEEYPFQESDLELKAYISKSLKKPQVPINKEPHWVLQNWDDIMAFMMCGTHLDREVHTVGDLTDPVQEGIGSYPQTPKGKGKGSGRTPKTPIKNISTTESATGQGTSSKQQEGDKDSGDKEPTEERNNQQGQRTSGNDPDDSGSDSSSDSESSSASSVKSILRPRRQNVLRGQRAKSVEQEQWESTTGISIPEGQKKLSKQLKGIKIEAPENLDSSEKKWTDSQYLDEWVNAVQRWLVIKGIDLDSAEALEVVGFKLKGSALTTYNHFRREKGKDATFFSFMLVLRDFLIPSTSKDLLWKRWETANPYNEGRHMGIKKFSNWLTEMQLKLIDKQGKQSISEEVKRRKFLNHLPPYMEATLIPQIKEDWTYEYLVQQAESYEASKRHIAVPTIARTPRQSSTKPQTPDRNRRRDGRQQRKTSFNPSNSNPSNRPAKSNPSNNPDWDTITRNLDQKTKMELIKDKRCLWCRNKGHNYKDCRKRQAKQPMVTAAQALSLQHQPRPKGFNKDKIKERPQFKSVKPEPTDFSKVLVKADGHPALALVDLQTQGGDLIDSKFVHLYGIPTRPSEKKKLTTAIKGSSGTIDKECTIQLDWMGYLEKRTFYVAHLSGWDMILGEPALSSVKALIPATKEAVTIQPPNMQRFPLTVWQRKRPQAGFRSAAIQITCEEVTDYSDEEEDAIVIASSKVEEQFNPVKEFPNLFPKTIPTELPPLREVNHRIDPIPWIGMVTYLATICTQVWSTN
jgi:hypothetical protein